MSMSQPDAYKVLSLRLPVDLHRQAKDIAEQREVSLTDYITRALRGAVAQELANSPSSEGDLAPYELHLQFVVTDHEPDQRAYQIVDGITNFAGLTGATEVTFRLTRLATMRTRGT
jgi:hypothetical protein